MALSLPGGVQWKHSLSHCQPLPTLQWGNNNTEMVALAPSQVAFQLLGTWQENNESLAVITHIHTKTKTQGLKKTFPLHLSYELLGSERWLNSPPIVLAVLSPLEQRGSRESGSWACLRGASMLPQTALPSGQRPVPAGCSLEQGLAAAPSPCGEQLSVPFDVVALGIISYNPCFSYCRWAFSHHVEHKVEKTGSRCFWSQRQQVRFYFTHLVLSAKCVLWEHLISIYTINNFEWESGKSINKPNISCNGDGTKHSKSRRCSVKVSWMKKINMPKLERQ